MDLLEIKSRILNLRDRNQFGVMASDWVSGDTYFLSLYVNKIALKRYADPDSMNDNPTVKTYDWDEIDAAAWDFLRYEDSLETVWGTF